MTLPPVLWLMPRSRAWSRLLALAASMGVSGQAWAQSGTAVANLSFGSFVVGGSGSVVVATSGARSSTGSVHVIGQGAGSSAARYTVTGSPYASYAITLPANGAVQLSDGNGNTMAVQSFVSNPSGVGILLANGTGEITLGATLVVGYGQAVGNYSGTFSITLEYQ
jgi:Domain of unknown function (DUF4402)